MASTHFIYSLPAIALLHFFSINTFAYTFSTTPNGNPVRWGYGSKFSVVGNPTGQDQLSPDYFKRAVIDGLQQWKWATHQALDFDYWQGTTSEYKTVQQQNGQSSIFFISNSHEKLDPNVIGYTKVWYNNETGSIIESDVMLNDKNFELTTSPQDTSSNFQRRFYGQRPKVFINNIITGI